MSTLTHPTPSPHHQRTSPLLSLPAELRNTIYTYILSPPHVPALRRLNSRNYVSAYVLPPLLLTPALLRTCRQIHAEATGILYAANTFAAHPALLTALPFLVAPDRPVLCPGPRARIRRWSVTVRLDTDPRFGAEEVRRAFSGTEELEVEVWQAQYRASDLGVLRLFEGVRGVGTARVCGSVEERYARWLEGAMMSGVGEEVEGYVEEGEEGEDASVNQRTYDLWVHGGR